ncbi:MAG: hypothetical protein JWQ43_2934 [Glaciihabitans sp.]|nr:hypothetical protein [Glaciihabitans sp.]
MEHFSVITPGAASIKGAVRTSSSTVTGASSTPAATSVGEKSRSTTTTGGQRRASRSTTRNLNRAPRPGAGQVRLRIGALGLSPLGVQAVATVDSVGADVVGFAAGDRVAMRTPSARPGFQPVVSERDLIGIPKDVSFEDAAAILPAALIARTVLRQLHTVGRGNRVYISPDPAGSTPFVVAWAEHLGGIVVNDDERASADVEIAAADYDAARRWHYGHGLAQLAASDVFQAMRDGAFGGVTIDRFPLSEASRLHSRIGAGGHSRPTVVLPASHELAA